MSKIAEARMYFTKQNTYFPNFCNMLGSIIIFFVCLVYLSPASESELVKVRMRRNIRLMEIPGTCRIQKTDKSLPPWKGRCMGFKYCLFDYKEDDGSVVHDSIKHDTCWQKGHNAECTVTRVVFKDVRCLYDKGTREGVSPVACLDSDKPGIDDDHVVWSTDKDPRIMNISKCQGINWLGKGPQG